MALYEVGLVLSADLGDDERTAFLSEIRELVTGEGGEIVKEDVWGKRKLAYVIDHKREGYYLFWQIESEGTLINPLEYKLRLSDQVMRYMTLNLDREMRRARKAERLKAAKKAAKAAAAAEREAAAEQAAPAAAVEEV